MGLVRFLLAAAVVINHTGPLYGLVLTDGYMAIKVFFIISGFYMALILTEKYNGPGQTSLFFSNRFLRLFPLYWVVLLLSLGVSLVFKFGLHTALLLGPWQTWLGHLKPATIALLAAANITIFGQDLLFFSSLTDAGTLALSTDALYRATPAWFFLLIPQSWTISLELVFYALAPWLVRRSTGVLVALAGASFVLRVLIYWADLPFDPWKQRFFPVECGFFLLGILAYRLYAALKPVAIPQATLWKIVGLYLAALLGYQFLPGFMGKELYLYAATVLSIPFLFRLTKKMAYDRTLGELSYPIYITHWTVILMVEYACGRAHLPAIALIATVAVSWLLNRFVADPIEGYRQRRVLRSR
ncbi:acyltransferase family protein [Desulfovibrio aerotolerans]|uniref:Acyltransferase family protein n=1 Tax=Solidesulfovibrio aerotolerans TaxID=295255 RepID=A0A7C9MNU6_9BACT|nr:acyltransferase [Solidesulfovibrio aerotolerans]MYL83052.1 acyltransferase family protein [Solidesulfovibrio aerotolerans]